MNDQSASNRATVPEQSVVASQEVQTPTEHYSGGNALLDAQVAAGDRQPSGEPIADPVASNFSRANETGDPTDEKNFTTTGAYPADQTQLEKDYNPPPEMSDRDRKE